MPLTPCREALTMQQTMNTKDKDVSQFRRKITVDWPDPPVAFQDILTDWEPFFPCLMIPWGGGRQIIYSVEDRNTYFKNTPPSWWLYPNTNVHLAGEEYRDGMGMVRLFQARITGGQIDAASWLINDIHLAEQDANQRAYAMVNLGEQPQGVIVSRPVQVSNKDFFNQYLQNFKNSGYVGALVRDIHAMYDDPQHAVLENI